MRLLRLLIAALLSVAVLASPAAAAIPVASISASSLSPVYGTAVTVSGRVTHVPTGTKVMLQRSLGTGWKYVRTVRTSSTSRYSTTYLATLGMNHLRVVIPPSGSRPRFVSPSIVVAAQLRTSPTPALTQRPVQVSGRLRTFVQRPVQLQVSRAGTVVTSTGQSDTAGIFTIATALPGTASVRIIAPRATVGSTTYDAFSTPWKVVTVVDPPFAASPAPTISGVPRFGNALTVGQQPWDTGAVLTYEWTRDGIPIAGATGTTYVLAVADIGSVLTVRATGVKSGYATTVRSSLPTPAIAPGLLAASVPSVSGVLAPEEVIHADPGVWTSGTQLAYAWSLDGVLIPGATGQDHTITTDEIGSRLSVTVRGTKEGYTPASRTSAQTAAIAQGVLHVTAQPHIEGNAQVGSALTAVTGTWDSGVTLACQWLRNGAVITGATTCSHAVTNADAGTRLSVRVTGTKPGWASAVMTSEQTDLVTGGALTSTPMPAVTGDPVVDGRLVAAPGSWDAGVSLAYQWRRAGVAIAGADDATYDPVASDVGSRISVTVTGSKPGFTAAARTSALTEPVAAARLVSAVPVVSGLNEPGETLTVAPGTWGPSPVQLSYRWLRDDVAIPGATSATYTVTDADRGSLLAAQVTGTKAGYLTASRTSALRAVSGPQSPSKVARALQAFHAALGDVDNEPLDVFVGPSDSLADGARATSIQKRWISVLRDDLRDGHQPAGVEGGFGYLDPFNWGLFPDDPISYVNGAGVFDQGLGRQSLALFGSTQTITVKDRLTDVDIVYSGRIGTAGAFTYSVDGGPEVRVSTGGKSVTRGGYVERISGLPAGTHEIVLRGAGGGDGNPAIVEGVMLYVGDRERGVRVWEGGASARRAFDYVAPQDGWADSLKEVHPDLVVLPIGSNDYAIGVSAEDTEARIREIIATIRSRVDTDPSIVLMPYYDRPTAGGVTWAEYEAMYARIAAADPDIAVFDLAPLFGAYGSAQRAGLMAADHIHPSDTGYALIAQELTAFLTGG